MPVPTLISDLSATIASNSPAGTESAKGTIDDYLRAHAAFIKQTSDLVTGATVTLASAATVNIGFAASVNVAITGAVTITAFDIYAEGALRYVKFSGALVLTHNAASLILPGSANITTAAGDVGIFKSLGGGNWACLVYQGINGRGIIQASGSASGWLSSTDWATFNGKQAALGYTAANVAGQAFTGAISAPTITETSDETLKENWEPLPDGLLDAFASIGKLGLFDWKADGAPGIGIGAQSLEAICARLVATDENGQKSVKYGVAALVMSYLLAQEVIALRGAK